MPSSSEHLTEARMGRALRPIMARGDDPFESFDRIASEVEFSQGRPDFVGVITGRHHRMTLPQIYARTRIPRSQIARVLTFIQREERTSLIDLAHAASMSTYRIRDIIRPLERVGVICTDADDMVRVKDLDLIARPDLWAFELKLDDWKRCLFQTLVCRSYARRVTAIFPVAKANHIATVAPIFAQHGIGVMLFDVITRKIRQVVETPGRIPLSTYCAWMACFEISDRPARAVTIQRFKTTSKHLQTRLIPEHQGP